jgi:adenosine deaminase
LALPKTDLHVHLDGSLRLGSLITLARDRGVSLPSQSEEGMKERVFKPSYANLGEYLAGFAYTCAVLQDPEALEQVAYELAWDNINEGVRYVEVRFAPQLHMGGRMSCTEVLQAVDRGLRRARAEHERSEAVTACGEPPFRYGIIVCAMRMFTPAFSTWYAQLCGILSAAPKTSLYATASMELARAAVRARDELGLPVVGFDLAGQEDGYPAHNHVEAFQYAHNHFLKKTVHAGEAYGAESIFDAITALHAERIGHGYHLFSPELVSAGVKDPAKFTRDLANYIADRRITIEVCITSNLQTNPAIGDAAHHALRHMLAERLSVSLCTDNRLVSHTTVTDELALAVDKLDVDHKLLRNLLIHGFKRSFYPGTYAEKRAWVRQIIDFYDTTIARHTSATAALPVG